MNWVNFNGRLVWENEPLFTAGNRGFKYGDGVFETLKVSNGNICLAAYHFERLATSLRLLQIEDSHLTAPFLQELMMDLCRQNDCTNSARLRLAAYRGEDHKAAFLLEAIPLDNQQTGWNERGWQLGLYPYARKSCDAFANLKSANYLPYVLANLYAVEKGKDEVLVLNSNNKIADGSKTNLFIIKDKELFTPALHQGCVNGVLRRFILEESKKLGYTVHQTSLSVTDLLEADEVFVTNAIQGIKWIQTFQEKSYENKVVKELHKLLFTL